MKKSKVKPKLDIKISDDQKIKKYNYGSFISPFAIQYWKEKYKKNFKKREMFLVIMQLRNGKYDMFTIATDESFFSYKKGQYYIDPDMIREDTHTGLNSLYYHQDCSTPFKISFNIDKLRNAVKTEDDGIEKALNPNNLKGFINSQVIEKVLKGQELSDEMKMMKMLIVITLIVSLGVAAMVGKALGWF